MQESKIPAMILFVILAAGITFAQEQKTGTISGKIMIKDGGPLAGGIVMFYDAGSGPPPSMTEYFRVPGPVSRITDDGSFERTLPEGRYYIGAIKKPAGEPNGPPKAGDIFFISEDTSGKPKVYSVKNGEKTAVDTIISGAAPFKSVALKKGATAVEGTVRDSEGKPIEGALVLAFATEDMAGVPLFVSDWTGKDGKYILRFHEGGKYYLRIREVYRGRPSLPNTGDKKIEPVIVTVETSEQLKGIDFRDIRTPEPPVAK